MNQTRAFDLVCAFGKPNGPRTSSFCIWLNAGKEDIHLGIHPVIRAMKASIHASGHGHAGLTNEFFREKGLKLKRRHLDQWQGNIQITDEMEHLYTLLFPGSELGYFSVRFERVDHWLPSPPIGSTAHLSVIRTREPMPDPYWPGKDNGWIKIASYTTPSGKCIWLLFRIRIGEPDGEIASVKATMLEAWKRLGHLPASPAPGGRIVCFVVMRDGGRGAMDIRHPSQMTEGC